MGREFLGRGFTGFGGERQLRLLRPLEEVHDRGWSFATATSSRSLHPQRKTLRGLSSRL